MKKITLLLMTALMSTGVMASPSLVKKLSKSRLAKELKATPGAFNSIQTQRQAYKAFYAGMPEKTATKLKAVSRAPEDNPLADLEPYISPYTYMYDEICEGYLLYNMFPAYVKIADGKAQFSLFELDPVEGVVETGDNWLSSKYGEQVDSITFNTDMVVATGETSGKEYVMGFSTYDYDEDGRLFTTRSESKTLGAYYFAEDGLLYIPSDIIVGIYDKDPAENEPVMAVNSLQLMPYSDIYKQILKGSYTAKDYYKEPLSGDILAWIDPWTNDNGETVYDFYVRGFDPIFDEAWLRMSQSEDLFTATMLPEQIVYSGGFYTDASRTESFDATILNIGLAETAGSLNYSYAGTENEGEMDFFVTVDEAENTFLLESDGESLYADYGIAEPDYYEAQTGLYDLLYDLNITITTEHAFDGEEDAGVQGVSGSNRVQSTEYFDLQGRRVSATHKGMTVRKTRLADGTIKSSKYIRK